MSHTSISLAVLLLSLSVAVAAASTPDVPKLLSFPTDMQRDENGKNYILSHSGEKFLVYRDHETKKLFFQSTTTGEPQWEDPRLTPPALEPAAFPRTAADRLYPAVFAIMPTLLFIAGVAALVFYLNPVPTKEQITAARRGKIKAKVESMQPGDAFSQDLTDLLNDDEQATGQSNLYMAVAGQLPPMGVLQASSRSSNHASGSIIPKEVYLSPLSSGAVAEKLWPLWGTYITKRPGYRFEELQREDGINAKMAEVLRGLVDQAVEYLLGDPSSEFMYSLNQVANEMGGIVDIKGKLNNVTKLDHEGKTQRVLSNGSPSNLIIQPLYLEYFNGPSAVAQHVVPALCGYCHYDKTSHGICSSYASTTYIRFIGSTHNQGYKAFMSQTVLDSSTGFSGGISTAQLIVYAAICSLDQPLLDQEPEKYMYHNGKVVEFMSDKAARSAARSQTLQDSGLTGGGAAPVDATTSTAGKKTRQTSHCAEVTLDMGGAPLTLLDQVVGRGLNGALRAGRWCGMDVVVKSAGLECNSCRLAELEQECLAYAEMQDLQGVFVPLVHGSYYTPTTLYLVLDRIRGHHTHDLDAVASPAQSKHAFEALSQLHNAGWLHGDLRSDNVILVDNSDKVMLIDLGRAQRRGTMPDKKWQLCKMEERRAMESIMGLC